MIICLKCGIVMICEYNGVCNVSLYFCFVFTSGNREKQKRLK